MNNAIECPREIDIGLCHVNTRKPPQSRHPVTDRVKQVRVGLGPPVQQRTSGSKLSPHHSVLRNLLHIIRLDIQLPSSNVLRHVFLGLPLFRLPPGGIHLIATFAWQCLGLLSVCPANLSLLSVTVLDNGLDFARFSTSSFVTWSL